MAECLEFNCYAREMNLEAFWEGWGYCFGNTYVECDFLGKILLVMDLVGFKIAVDSHSSLEKAAFTLNLIFFKGIS